MEFQHTWENGGFKHFVFSSLPGEMIQFDSHFSSFFKGVGFNHQLDGKMEALGDSTTMICHPDVQRVNSINPINSII